MDPVDFPAALQFLVQPGDQPGRTDRDPPLPSRTGSAGGPPADLEAKRRAYRDSKRLAYVTEAPVWWCEQLGTVLANEEVIDGKSEVGGFPVVRKPMRQWMLRITAYAERLLQDLDTIDWSDSLKEMQRNWIGRSEGAEVDFQIAESVGCGCRRHPRVHHPPGHAVRRHLHGAGPGAPAGGRTSPPPEQRASRRRPTRRKSPRKRPRTHGTGQGEDRRLHRRLRHQSGQRATNPDLDRRLRAASATAPAPSWRCPATTRATSNSPRSSTCRSSRSSNRRAGEDWHGFVDDGIAVNSSSPEISINGLPTPEAKRKITAWLEARAWAEDDQLQAARLALQPAALLGRTVPHRLEDGRGRPAYHEALPESALPVLPPALDDYKPTPDGQPPLARAKDWVNLPDGSHARDQHHAPMGRQLLVLPALPGRRATAARSAVTEAERYWMGAPAVNAQARTAARQPRRGPLRGRHRARRAAPALRPVLAQGAVRPRPRLHAEPFYKLVNRLILGEDGQKMSKSRGNVINPDDILAEYGADAFRLYEMFMGPLEMVKPWNTKGVEGVYRFLGRVWRLFVDEAERDRVRAEPAPSSPERGAASSSTQIRLSPRIQDVPPTPRSSRRCTPASRKSPKTWKACASTPPSRR